MTASSEVPRLGSTSTIDTALVQVSTPSHHHILTPSPSAHHTQCVDYTADSSLTYPTSSQSHPPSPPPHMQNAGSINMYIYTFPCHSLSPRSNLALHLLSTFPLAYAHTFSPLLSPLPFPHTGYTRRLYGGHLTVPTAPPKVGYHGDEGYRRNTPELRSQRSVFDYEGNNHVTEYTVTSIYLSI